MISVKQRRVNRGTILERAGTSHATMHEVVDIHKITRIEALISTMFEQ